MIWNISPEIVSLGPIHIRWYGLMFLFGFSFGFKIMRKIFISEIKPVTLLEPLLVYMIFGTIIGARLGHCLFYEPEVYLADPLRILKIWEGGLASHGGVLGNFIALLLFTHKHKEISLSWLLDRICIPTALAASLIRIGNLFNSEIIGHQTNVPWAVTFIRIDNLPRHPTQIYESISYIFIFFLLNILYKRLWIQNSRGFLFGLFLILIFGTRIVVEFFKENQVAFEQNLPMNMGQLLSIPLIIIGITLIFRSLKSEPSHLN